MILIIRTIKSNNISLRIKQKQIMKLSYSALLLTAAILERDVQATQIETKESSQKESLKGRSCGCDSSDDDFMFDADIMATFQYESAHASSCVFPLLSCPTKDNIAIGSWPGSTVLSNWGAWCPNIKPAFGDTDSGVPIEPHNSALVIDLGCENNITGIGLQGKQNQDGVFLSWVKSVTVTVYNPCTG